MWIYRRIFGREKDIKLRHTELCEKRKKRRGGLKKKKVGNT